MENKRTAIIILSIAGILFSGFLASQWFSGVCNGGCSLLYGYPTCLYGMMLFALILACATFALFHTVVLYFLRIISLFGVLFSLYFIIEEFKVCVFCYWLGLPNCAYGFIVFSAVFVLAMLKKK